MNDLNQAIEAYLALREQHKEADRVAKQLYWAMKSAEGAAVDAMLDNEIQSITDSAGVRVNLRSHVSCSVTVANQDQIREWLTEAYGDDKDYVEEKVIKTEITKLIKANPENEFPDFLKVDTRPGLSVSGA